MKVFFTITTLIISVCCFGQLKTVSLTQLDSLIKQEPRPVYLFLHTDWCKVCLMMEETTLKNKRIVSLLNEHFYVVFFNPERELIPEKVAPHLEGKKVYPSSYFFNAGFQFLVKKEGLLKKETLHELLTTIIDY